MELVVSLCDRLIVLDSGVKLTDGVPQTVVARSDVQEAYFGR